MKKLLISVLALFFSASLSYAQGPVNLCFTTNGTNCVPAIQASNSVNINTASSGTIQLIPLVAGKRIYITALDIISAGTTTFTFVYGTGTNCGTGTAFLAGPYTLVANAGISKASGLGPVLFVPAGNALCFVNNNAIGVGGSLSYAQF